MQNWNLTTERAQRVDEKNGVVCLVITFTPRARPLLTGLTQIYGPSKTYRWVIQNNFFNVLRNVIILVFFKGIAKPCNTLSVITVEPKYRT